MISQRFSHIFVAGLLALMVVPSVQADEPVACAAILPCDSQGNVLEEYVSEGPCFDLYKAQCGEIAVKSCGIHRESAEKEVRKLQKKLRQAKRLAKIQNRS